MAAVGVAAGSARVENRPGAGVEASWPTIYASSPVCGAEARLPDALDGVVPLVVDLTLVVAPSEREMDGNGV